VLTLRHHSTNLIGVGGQHPPKSKRGSPRRKVREGAGGSILTSGPLIGATASHDQKFHRRRWGTCSVESRLTGMWENQTLPSPVGREAVKCCG